MFARWNAGVQSAACANYEYQYPRNINMIGSSTVSTVYCTVVLYCTKTETVMEMETETVTEMETETVREMETETMPETVMER